MARRQRRTREKPAFKLEQLPVRQLQNPYAPVNVLDEEAIELIHDGSMRVLEQIGLEIMNDRARELMIKAGATIDSKTGYVLMDRGLVMEKISTIPAEFTLHARNLTTIKDFGDGESEDFRIS